MQIFLPVSHAVRTRRSCLHPSHFQARTQRCAFRGSIDAALHFDDGSYGIIDFKTVNPRDSHVTLYTMQLHAYALAFEQPATEANRMAPVTTLALLCFEPEGMIRLGTDDYAYRARRTWIEVERDDAAFLSIMNLVAGILAEPNPPTAGENCVWCLCNSPCCGLSTGNQRSQLVHEQRAPVR
jgi:hypothetical protein